MKIFSPILKGTTTVAQGTTNLSGSFTGSLLGTAATASYADNFTVGGTLTAQTINVQIITSSIEFNTGSTRNGSSTANTHQFTGSVLVTGSATTLLSVNNNVLFVSASGNVGVGTAAPINRLHLATPTNGDISLRFSDQDDNESFGLVPEANSGNGKLYFMARSGYNTAFTSSTDAKITMQTNGNVGIGTTSPTQILDVRKATSNGDTQFNFLNSQSSLAGNTSVTSTIYLGFYDDGTGTANANKIISGKSGDYTSQANANSFLAFATTAANATTERMRILSSGNIGIGMTTSTYNRVSIKSNSATAYAGLAVYAASNGDWLYMNHTGTVGIIGTDYDGSAGAAHTPILIYAGNDERMRFSVNGNIGAGGGTTNIYNASDIRLKKNITPITLGLNAISALNPVKFNWADGFDEIEADKELLGFIAQEVQTVIPEAVEIFGGNSLILGDTTIDNPLRVNEKFIIPVLVKAIQELSAKNTLLEERLTALENN